MARSCVGTPFRPQGRLPGVGLDCLGVVLVATVAAGVPAPCAPAYALSGDGNGERLLAGLVASGCREIPIAARAPGDLALFTVAPDRPHLAILAGGALIHADLGLRAVVEGPARAGWRLQSIWRFATGD